MSGIGNGLPDGAKNHTEYGAGRAEVSAIIVRGLARLLTSSTKTGRRGDISPAGLAHSVSVCAMELSMRSKNGKKPAEKPVGNGLPTFVDVKLTPEQRVDFKAQSYTAESLAKFIAGVCDDGYRVGVAWSGQQQAYTVSLTCRDAESPNNGLCMTSFAGDLLIALALAAYKHVVITEGRWVDGVDHSDEGWG